MHTCGRLLNHWPADIFAWIVYLLEPCYGSLFNPDVHALGEAEQYGQLSSILEIKVIP